MLIFFSPALCAVSLIFTDRTEGVGSLVRSTRYLGQLTAKPIAVRGPANVLLIPACQPLAGLIAQKRDMYRCRYITRSAADALKASERIYFTAPFTTPVDDLFLADHIEDDDRDQRQQIGRERQVVVRTELRLECQLRQRQCVLILSLT